MEAQPKPLILIIDDREDLVRFCERSLGDACEFRHVTGARAAEPILRDEPVAGVLLDRDFSHADPAGLLGPPEEVRDEGLHILRWLRREHPRLPVLMVTGFRELQTAHPGGGPGHRLPRLGGRHRRPGDPQGAAAPGARVERGAPGERCSRASASWASWSSRPRSPAPSAALHQAMPGRAPILLLGETGTGKDALAYAVHALSGDPLRPYVSVNVASLNPGLIESELFGHARGAFTGADRASVGKLRFAHGGTLFLNEVGDLTSEVQAKLLTAVERNEVVPVGEVQSLPAEFRLITATSRDLRALVEGGQFRRDLFHRIAWHMIEIPPLRERREDIPALVHSFLRDIAPYREGMVFGIAREALEYLVGLPWAGNVRELRARSRPRARWRATSSRWATCARSCDATRASSRAGPGPPSRRPPQRRRPRRPRRRRTRARTRCSARAASATSPRSTSATWSARPAGACPKWRGWPGSPRPRCTSGATASAGAGTAPSNPERRLAPP